jgi:hypothetical protein
MAPNKLPLDLIRLLRIPHDRVKWEMAYIGTTAAAQLGMRGPQLCAIGFAEHPAVNQPPPPHPIGPPPLRAKPPRPEKPRREILHPTSGEPTCSLANASPPWMWTWAPVTAFSDMELIDVFQGINPTDYEFRAMWGRIQHLQHKRGRRAGKPYGK